MKIVCNQNRSQHRGSVMPQFAVASLSQPFLSPELRSISALRDPKSPNGSFRDGLMSCIQFGYLSGIAHGRGRSPFPGQDSITYVSVSSTYMSQRRSPDVRCQEEIARIHARKSASAGLPLKDKVMGISRLECGHVTSEPQTTKSRSITRESNLSSRSPRTMDLRQLAYPFQPSFSMPHSALSLGKSRF
jgi:hypothetical protein